MKDEGSGRLEHLHTLIRLSLCFTYILSDQDMKGVETFSGELLVFLNLEFYSQFIVRIFLPPTEKDLVQKEISQLESKFFSFRVDPFSGGN